MSATLEIPKIDYPSSDGEPMAETGIHVNAIILLHQALEDYFAERSDVFIASDMFWYWQEGNAKLRVAPDVMVVQHVGNHDRRSFRSFDEGGAIPSVVFEMASEGTWRDDEERKHALYEELGVEEYFLFDPEWQYLSSPLKGYRLVNSAYRRIYSKNDRLDSLLGFQLAAEGTMLRLFNKSTGLPILTRAEAVEAAQAKVAEQQQHLAEQQQHLAEQQQHLAEHQIRLVEERRRGDALQVEIDRLTTLLQAKASSSGSSP